MAVLAAPMLPLFVGGVGGPELVVIFLMMVLLGLPLFAILLGGVAYLGLRDRQGTSEDEDSDGSADDHSTPEGEEDPSVEELQTRIDRLEAEVELLRRQEE